jgi:hypothetical protein
MPTSTSSGVRTELAMLPYAHYGVDTKRLAQESKPGYDVIIDPSLLTMDI